MPAKLQAGRRESTVAPAAIVNESEACCRRSLRSSPICHARTGALGNAGAIAVVSGAVSAARAALGAISEPSAIASASTVFA